MSEKVVGLGAGGHAKVVLEIVKGHVHLKIVGMLDNNSDLHGKKLLGVPVLGDDELLPELLAKGVNRFFVGVGGVGNNQPRQRLFEFAVSLGMKPVSAIHSSAVISPSVTIGSGSVVMAGAIINASTKIGVNNIVNTGAILEHDCVLGDHVHVATGARLASSVTIGDGAHVGIGATIRQLINIGQGATIGAGSVVVKDVQPGSTVMGVPARIKDD